MESGNTTSRRANFCLESLVMPGEDRIVRRGRTIAAFLDRPSCPECGSKPYTKGSQWACRTCKKTWVKEHKPVEARPVVVSIAVQDRPRCAACGGLVYGKGKLQYKCKKCGKTISARKLNARRNKGAKPVQSGNLEERLKSVCPEGAQILLLGGCKIS